MINISSRSCYFRRNGNYFLTKHQSQEGKENNTFFLEISTRAEIENSLFLIYSERKNYRMKNIFHKVVLIIRPREYLLCSPKKFYLSFFLLGSNVLKKEKQYFPKTVCLNRINNIDIDDIDIDK